MLHKRDIDTEVAALLGMPRSRVAAVTYLFIRTLTLRLIDEHILYLDGFGMLRLFRNKAGWISVRVAKSPAFKAFLQKRWSGAITKYDKNNAETAGPEDY